jgi:hypothetical protein
VVDGEVLMEKIIEIDFKKNIEKIKWKNFFDEQPQKGQRVFLRKVQYRLCEYEETTTSWDFVNNNSRQKDEKIIFQWVTAEEFFDYMNS